MVAVPADALQLSLRVEAPNDLADAVLLRIVNALVPLQLSLVVSFRLPLGCECRHVHACPVRRMVALRPLCPRVSMQVVEVVLAMG